MMKYLWLLLAAGLSYLGAGDQPLSLAAWFAPVFLLRFFRQAGLPRGFGIALVVLTPVWFFGFLEMNIAPLSVFLISTVVGTAVDLLPYTLDHWLNRKLPPLAATLVLPCAGASVAFLLTLFGTPPFGSMAYIAHDDPRFLQLASITGVWGFVFLPYWLAAVLNRIWEAGLRSIAARRSITAILIVFLVVYGYGTIRLALSPGASESIRVAGITPSPQERAAMMEASMPLVTPGDSATEEAVSAFRRAGLDLASKMLMVSEQQAKAGAKIVVWSETPVNVLPEEEKEILERARRISRENEIFLGVAMAVVDRDYRSRLVNGEPLFRNKLFMLTPNGTVAWEYLKTHLVAGTYEAQACVPGDGILHIVDTPVGAMSGVICYDLDFPVLIRSAGRSGARILVAPSNDWPEIRHTHARMARLRAIENGFALLRPTSNGLSIAVDSFGRTAGRVDAVETGGEPLLADVPIHHVSTVYSWVGDSFAYLCLAALALLLGLKWLKPSKRPVPRA